MAPRKSVLTLEQLSLVQLSHFFQNLVEEIAQRTVQWSQQMTAALDAEEATAFRKMIVDDHVDIIRQTLISNVAPAILGRVVEQVLLGIKRAADAKRCHWRPEIDSAATFSQEMVAIVACCDLIITPRLKILDLTEVIKMLRSRIFDILPQFTGLQTLILGSGSGGVSNIYHDKFLQAVKAMPKLVHFSLTYDCTDEILSNLADTCHRTLKILDVEYSTQVTDEAIDSILKCREIQRLHIFHTGISLPGKAQIIVNLKRLRVLVRGDFLCDALDYLDHHLDILGLGKLELEEFWSSEDYYFHDYDQMQLLCQMCPKMRKIMYQYNSEIAGNDLCQILSPFACLTELHNWGGNFYKDKLQQLLEVVGDRLQVLYLIHVDQIDIAALAFISRNCGHRLKTLGFYNCSIGELQTTDLSTQVAINLMSPMLTLEKLFIVSEAQGAYLIALIASAFNLTHITTGSMTAVDDDCFAAILSVNQLHRLQELKIAKTSDISAATVYRLIHQCPQLRSVKMLEFWSSISKKELEAIRRTITYENYDVDTGEREENAATIGRRAITYWSRQLHSLQQGF